MVEIYLIIIGLIFFAWLYFLVRQTQRGFSVEDQGPARPVVPLNLAESDEAVVVAEGRGRIVYANESARDWFGLNGGAPNLTLMAQRTQPADSLHDLLAGDGQATFRLGPRQIEAVSHTVPTHTGQQTVVVMRERTGRAPQIYSEYDPLRALAILEDISTALGISLDLDDTVNAIMQSIEQTVEFNAGEITLWDADNRVLRPIGRRLVRTPTGSLVPAVGGGRIEYKVGEGYGGWIAMYRQPLLINNVAGRTDVMPRAFHDEFQSYVGVPLTIGERLVGTLELAHRERNAFTQRDVSLLQAVGGQTAAAIEAARLYTSQTTRVEELSGLQQIAQAMSQLGEPRELYGQLTQRIAALMDVGICGVLLYDEDAHRFHSQLPFHGVPDRLIAHYSLTVVPDTALYAIWHHQPWWFTNDPDSDMVRAMGFEDLRSAMPITSLALVPMIVGARRTGLLLVANRHDEDGFDENVMRMLMSYAAQAAVVSENARLYLDEQRRTRELSGLQQIAQAIGVLRSPDELYGQITGRIAELMNVEMCGILLFDPEQGVLVSQRPFYGMEDEEAVNFYQLPSPRGGQVATLWQERDTWFSNDLRRDPDVADTDLARLSQAVGITQTVLATLVVGGTRQGIIQVSNRRDHSDFTVDDARLLSIFAGQAAVLIDNARLYREMQLRTHEAEGLRAVTEIASQVMPDADTIERVVIAIANLLESRLVSIALVEEGSGQLVIEPEYIWGVTLKEPLRFDTYASGFESSVLVTRKPFLSNDLRHDENVLPEYRAHIDRFELHNAVQVPLTIMDRSIGELTVANKTGAEGYTLADIELLQAIGTQVAAMVDRQQLYAATDQDLRARVHELDALSRVSHELSQTLDLSRILDVIRQEALRSTDATAVSVVLLTDRDDWEDPDDPVIEQRFGEGRTLRELTPIERAAVVRNDVMLVDDYAQSEFEAVPRGAASALVVPITFGESPVGLIHMYGSRTQIFNQRVTDFALALTDQATIAIHNARRYQEQLTANRQLQVRAERMGRIFELGEMFRQGAELPELLEEIAHSIQETVGFNIVLISVTDERAGVLRRTAQAGMPLTAFEEVQKVTPPLEQARGLMLEQYRISNSFFLPGEGTADLIADVPVYRLDIEVTAKGPHAWDPEDLLLIPITGSGGTLLGLMSVDEPRSGRRPDLHTVEALEIFSNQAAFLIENVRLVQRIQQEAEATRRERDRLAQLHLVTSEIQRARDVPARLQVVADGIHQAGWGRVVITLRDESLEPTALIQSGYSSEEALKLSDEVTPGDVWRRWINDLAFYEMKLGAGYYLRYDHPWVAENVRHDAPPEPASVPEEQWHPQDALYLLLMGQDQKRIIGIIQMEAPVDGRVPTEASLQPFELFASQAAAAIETTRLYLETVRAAEQEARLNEMMEVVSASISPEAIITAIGRGLQQMVPVTRMSVAMYDQAADRFTVLRADIALDESVTVVEDEPLSAKQTATGATLRQKEARLYLMGVEPELAERFTDLGAWYATGERSTLLVPMIAAGQVVGAIRLGSELETPFGFSENLDVIQRLANLSAVALENVRLFEQARERAAELDSQAQRLTLINRVATRLAQSLDRQEIFGIALEEMQGMLQAQSGGVLLYDGAESARLVLGTHPDAKGTVTASDPPLTVPLAGNRAVEIVRETRAPLAAENILEDDRFKTGRKQLKQRGTRSMLVVPLTMGRDVLGSIGLDFNSPRTFGESEIELCETIANQVSVALEKANLLAETEERAVELISQAHRLASLNQMSARLAESFDPQEIYRIILEELQAALNCQSGGLMMIDHENQISRLVLSTHPQDPPELTFELPLQGNPVAEYMMATRQPLVAEDIPNDPRFASTLEVHEARNTAAMLIVPVIMGEQVIGTIGLDSETPRSFSEAEIEMAITAANQAAVAIEKSRLFTETQQRASELNAQAQRLALINRISTRLAQTLDAQEIYRIVLNDLQDALGAQFSGLVLFEGDQIGRMMLDTHPDNYGLSGQVTIPLVDNPSITRVRETLQPVVSEKVLKDPLFEPVWPLLEPRGTQSLMIVPLVVGGNVVGTIGVDFTSHRKFSDAEIELAATIANQASLAIEKARLYDETLGLTIFNQAVVESIQQGIVVLDRDLHVRRINRFMVERYGWTDEANGQLLFKYRPDYEKFLRAPMAVALALGEQQVQYEVERQAESGQPSIRNYYVYPMMEGARVTGLVLLLEDVTERARLEADLNERAVQMAALSEVSSQITSTLEPREVITVILDALGRVIDYDGVSLWLRVPDRDELEIVAARGYRDPDSPEADDLIGLRVEIPYSALFREMSAQARVINVGDVSAGDPRFPYGSAAIYKNWLGAPLITKGNVTGVLTLEKREPDFYGALQEQLALTFANQAAVALDNAQLFQVTRHRAQELDDQAQRLALLNRVSLALAQTLDLENIMEIALREAALALDIPEASAVQIDSGNRLARVIVEYPRGDAPPERTYDITNNEAILRVQQTLLPLVVERLVGDPIADDLQVMMRRDDVASTMLVPLVVGGEVIGVLWMNALKQRQFAPEQIELAQTIASQAAIAVQNAALFEQSSIRTNELETLFESAQATAVTLDLDEVSRRVTVQMLGALRADSCTVSLWDDVSNQLIVRSDISARPEGVPSPQPGDRIRLDQYPLREKALRERELLTLRADDDKLPPAERELMVQNQSTSRMLIPLVVNEISIGLVEIETVDPNHLFRVETIRLARTLASQAAISIENARLQTETRRTVEEMYIINDMSGALSSASDLDQLLAVIDAQLPSLTDAQAIYVALYDPLSDTINFPLAVSVVEDASFDLHDCPMGRDEFSMIIRQKAPLLLAGENLDQVRRSLGIDTLVSEASCFLGVPLFAGDEVIGALAIRDDDDPLAFSHNDQRILTTVGSQLGVAIQSTRLFQQTVELAEVLDQRVQERTLELEQERQHIQTLYQITTELTTSLDMDRLLNRALEMVAQAVDAAQGAILAVDPISERLHFRAVHGWPEVTDGDTEDLSIALNEGLAGWAVTHHQSLMIADVQKDSRWLRLTDADDDVHAALISLIESNEDILGVTMLYSDEVGAFNEDHGRLVSAVSNQIANAMNNAELYSLIRDQAERLGAMLREQQVEATKSNSILDSVADGVMVADADGNVIVFNQTAARVLRLPVDEVLHKGISTLAGLYGGGETRWGETIEIWQRDPASYEPGYFLEERITLEDERIISVRLSPVHMGDQFLGTVSIFRDITREVEVDRLKSEFVATVSHELRTPMTSIKGYADLLLLGAAGEISDQQQRFLETIKQNADRLSILVNDLLDISRIDQGRMELRFSAVEVPQLLEDVAKHLNNRSRDEGRPMEIMLSLPEDPDLTVWGDHDKIQQIMINLADNSFNYTLPNGTITLGTYPVGDGDHVVLSISDTGIGIPPEAADRVYERFFRGDETDDLVMDTPGTGLGLSIVKELVEVHQGRIWFESELGQGTTFFIELPSGASGQAQATQVTQVEAQE